LQLKDASPDRLRRIFHRAAEAAEELKARTKAQPSLLSDLLERVTLGPSSIRIEVRRPGLANLLSSPDAEAVKCSQEPFGFTVPIQLKRRGVEAKLVMHAGSEPLYKPDAKLITVLADAQRWIRDLAEGRAVSVRDLARQSNRDSGEVSRTLPLAFLEPSIVEAIIEGRQPVGLTPRALKRIAMLPHSWPEQRRRLGFPHAH
jgi:site-specific DNA recombinase